MPWKDNSSLPDGVKNSLPSAAQTVFREVFNFVKAKGGSDESAARQSWTAVKNGWEKNKDGDWVRKPSKKDASDADLAKGANAMSNDNIAFFMPITKKEPQKDGSVIVTGYASTPTKDLDGEIISLDACKKALPAYMEWRNIRAMHQAVAVGTAKEANVDDNGLYLRARIVEPGAVHLVNEGVYQGYSIGGRKIAKQGDTITELELVEISIVDRPCNPDTRFAIAKMAGGKTEIVNSKRIELIKAVDPIEDMKTNGIKLDVEEVGFLGRLIHKLSGGVIAKTAEDIRPNAGAGHRPLPKDNDGEVTKDDDLDGDVAADDDIENDADAGKKPYGDVEYADPGYQEDKKKRYPVDTEEHIRAAWSYIGKPKNQKKYSAEQVGSIKSKIESAWKSKIDKEGPPSAAEKAHSAAWALSKIRELKDPTKLAKSADLYTISRMIDLLGQLEWLEECCEGDMGMCCGPGGAGTVIKVEKEFNDRFGALLVQFGDMTSELLDKAIAQMKAEEAEEAAAKIASTFKLARGEKPEVEVIEKTVGKPLTFTEVDSEGDDAADVDAMTQLAKIAGEPSEKITVEDPMATLEAIAKQAESGHPRPDKPKGNAFAELQELYQL